MFSTSNVFIVSGSSEISEPAQISRPGHPIPLTQGTSWETLPISASELTNSDYDSGSDDPDIGGLGALKRRETQLLDSIEKKKRSKPVPRSPRAALRDPYRSAEESMAQAEASTQRWIGARSSTSFSINSKKLI